MIYLPATSADGWRQLLADPELHWVPGYSAHTIAHCWQQAGDIPPEVRTVLRQESVLSELETLLIIPEHKVPLPGGRRASQTDVWVLARNQAGLISIAVEGKVNEPFGPTVAEWLTDASEGKRERLAYIREQLGFSRHEELPAELRYQLLHRAASAVIEARRFSATQAVMLVQSWSQEDRGFADFSRFVKEFGGEPRVDGITATVRGPSDVKLYCAWVRGNPEFCLPRTST